MLWCLTRCLPLITALAVTPTPCSAADQPDVILIMTDDQGYGDFGIHGNPIIGTPHLDAMARRSVRVDPFYVSPVCAPTRASLMTGRYHYRTRVVDTWVGRAMMEPEEVTIAEALGDAGYATAIFGKWHLGDCYPMRPMDQGFQESLVHRGGGIGQPADEPGYSGYFDPMLWRNGKGQQYEGYCTDVYFDEAMKWIEDKVEAEEPYFCYLATNAPHTPLKEVPLDHYGRTRVLQPSPEDYAIERGEPLQDDWYDDSEARIYAMIRGIDDGIGRLFERLEAMGRLDNTLVVFLNDNGPNSQRYVSGLRGMKTEVFEGGIRSPLFVHWPAKLAAGRRENTISAHIDVMPTLLEACGIDAPTQQALDGRSLWPVMLDADASWPERPIVTQVHRGDVPQLYQHMAVRLGDWKLLHPTGFGGKGFEGEPTFLLYNLALDPYEQSEVACKYPDVVERLHQSYIDWWDDVSHTRVDNFAPPRIVLDAKHEDLVTLTRQDWRAKAGGTWVRFSHGTWKLRSERESRWDVTVRLMREGQRASVLLTGCETAQIGVAEAGATELSFSDVSFPAGMLELEAICRTDEKTYGAFQVVLRAR
ncbi:MAG: arylsulfatase A-like enzyme [Planctomycetota bacterium]|jgi:arylsulfatase A-like enzyme